jgi:hypothetical protein
MEQKPEINPPSLRKVDSARRLTRVCQGELSRNMLVTDARFVKSNVTIHHLAKHACWQASRAHLSSIRKRVALEN